MKSFRCIIILYITMKLKNLVILYLVSYLMWDTELFLRHILFSSIIIYNNYLQLQYYIVDSSTEFKCFYYKN